MSSQTATAPAKGKCSESPSPVLTDAPPREIEDEGSIGDTSPPSDVPDVEVTEPPTVLANPLTTDDEEPNGNASTVSMEPDHVITVSTAPGHVTECATIYSVLMACITTSYTAMYTFYARTGDEKVYKFWTATILPMSASAMAISFALKPRREDRAYKAFLVIQYVLFTFVSEILAVVGQDFAKSQIIQSSVLCTLYLALLKFGLKCRPHVAQLSDEDLSKFLANDVIFGGMIIGLGQLAFLMFASIQCDGNADDWRQCNRTLFSQTGLSGMVTLFTIIKLASGVVPKRILNKHVISPRKVLAMDLNVEEAVQAFGLSIAALCALYPLGNYGAEGSFRREAERYAALIVPSTGGFCLLLTAVWKAVVIRGEMRRGAEETGQLNQGGFSSDGTLMEASSFWFYIGVLATTYQSIVCVAAAVTMDKNYQTLSRASAPIVILAYVESIFNQPRRRSPKDMRKLRLHFMSFAFISEMALAVYVFRQGNFGRVIQHFARFAAQMLLLHFGLKLRAAVGRLPDKDVETFLVDMLFKGGLQTLFSILFLIFRTTKCMFEKGLEAEICSDTSFCSTVISIYLLLWWSTKLVQGSVRSEWRKDLNLSMEKIARMRDISLRRGVAGFLTLVTGVCAIFLFSMMSADELDETTITVVGLTGFVASVGVVVSEIFSILKAQRRRMIELSESGQIVEQATELEEPVEECSWVFVGVSFLLSSAFAALKVCYGVTLEDKHWLMADVILPIVALSLVMAMFYKPKRTDVGYKRFLYFHFFTFAIVSEVGTAIGDFRLDLIFNGFFAIFRALIYFCILLFTLKLRASAAKLPSQELSDFLCQTVLVKGTVAMGPMLFFSFETVSCLISQDSLSNGQCNNTSFAATFLSLYLAILTTVSIASKTVPKSVQRETAWEFSSIASLKGLKRWQQIQGGLVTITAIVSLYLLSVLGVEGNQNSTVYIVGITGALSMVSAELINMTMLVRTRNEHQRNTTIELPPKQRSVRGISAGELQEGMIAATFV
ncbi:hypothetical protein TrVE_jg13446 [Triparma verrucosa]|uniref:Uncharacterized protein n=1 Tax=Triparma verrucosa TaxID=1606542 RepID=A0A9W7FCZ7_9STRA|nr:hypothetical protein TrVE_jg13446 [Triparma verrucosa]